MRHRVLALSAAAVLAILAVACGVPESSDFRPIGGADVADLQATTSTTTTTTTTLPTTTTSPETTLTVLEVTTTVPSEPVDLYYVVGEQLQAVPFPLTPDPSARQILDALVAALDVLGPAATGLRSAVPPGSTFDVSIRGGVAYVDMTSASLTTVPADGRLEFGQIVLTLLSNVNAIGQVSFTVDGNPLAYERGDGSQVDAGAVTSRDDYVSLIAG